MSGWIGVDLDGTLAIHGHMPYWDGSIGPPVASMVERVKAWLAEGKDVRIVTARVAFYPFNDEHADEKTVECQRAIIEAWLLEHIGTVLPITAMKDYGMIELWDDRAISIIRNTGERCCNGRD